MSAENVSRMGAQLRDNVSEIATRAKTLSAQVKERLDATYQDLGGSVRRAKAAADDRLDDIREKVKDRPLTSVTTVAAGAFAIGMITGLLIGRKSRS